jgi:RNA polymerase sigma-70 factor, ECF subfamily
MVNARNELISGVENLHESIVVALDHLNQIYLAGHDGNTGYRGLPSEGSQGAFDHRRGTECTAAREACREPWHRPHGQDNRRHEARAHREQAHPRLRCRPIAAYTRLMIGVGNQAAPVGMLAPQADVPAPVTDPVSHLAAVYRDYPGLRALILRRVRDPELAADILQDAAVTTLEKLRSGEIAHPENVGGFLYRVALNHLRNHRRKDRSALSSADGLDELPASENDADWEDVRGREWATAARRMLEEMPVARDREVLVRFYLDDEDREKICRALRLSEAHFNRVIFRARNRFRELIEHRGFRKADLLTIAAAIGLCLSGGVSGGLSRAGQTVDACNASVAIGNAVSLRGVK